MSHVCGCIFKHLRSIVLANHTEPHSAILPFDHLGRVDTLLGWVHDGGMLARRSKPNRKDVILVMRTFQICLDLQKRNQCRPELEQWAGAGFSQETTAWADHRHLFLSCSSRTSYHTVYSTQECARQLYTWDRASISRRDGTNSNTRQASLPTKGCTAYATAFKTCLHAEYDQTFDHRHFETLQVHHASLFTVPGAAPTTRHSLPTSIGQQAMKDVKMEEVRGEEGVLSDVKARQEQVPHLSQRLQCHGADRARQLLLQHAAASPSRR